MSLYSLTRTTDPVGTLLGLQREVGRIFDQPFGLRFGVAGQKPFPPVTVSSDAEGSVLRMEVPGIKPEDLEIEAQGRTLVVRGKRDAAAAEDGALRRQERWSGEFSRSFSIPEDFDADGAEANYEYGVLTVKIPKRAELQPRRISVEAA